MKLDASLASKMARIALGHVGQEYPHKLDHVLESDADALPPRVLHPIFYGSFDWHSCVHGWWTLLTLRRLFPEMAEAAEIAERASASFAPEKVALELAYLDRPSSCGFERPYGWAWLLYLHLEASRHEDSSWSSNLQPLATAFAAGFKDYITKLTYPITVGSHFNTAFALTLAHEWAMHRDADLLVAIEHWAEKVFRFSHDYRGWEPGGDEFLSPALTAAHLMSRVRGRADFVPWLEAFLINYGQIDDRFAPASVSDRTDGKFAHLDGLNLSRAWSFRVLARKIAPHPRLDIFEAQADRHLAAAMPHLSGDYAGEHWLATFALLALLSPGSA